ncbi:MAG: Flp family type IVb pilin [Geobacter sp.]|nr:MAG: Flp family type IVb pilin [Geobacter sp.]
MTLIKRIRRHVSNSLHSSRGQTLVEYALILLLIAIVVIVILASLGKTVNNTYSEISSSVTDAGAR